MTLNTRKDLLVVLFCKALLEVSHKEHEDEVISRNNKDYKTNKRIDRRLDKIEALLENTQNKMYQLGGAKVVKWIKYQLPKRIGNTLSSLEADRINLESLAIQVLYINFADFRGALKLHSELQWLQEPNQWLELMELMSKTSIGVIEEDMNMSANKVLEKIKG